MNKTLGVSMIVRDESQCIETCLDSVKDADEIVIVDTGSKDNTVELCRKYTDKIYTDGPLTFIRKLLLFTPFYQKKYKHLWRDDFQYSRNLSLNYCTADFILIIDADEVLINPIAEIRKKINEYWFRQYFGLMFIVKTDLQTFDSPRLFKRIPEIYYVNAIHNLPSWKGDPDELKTRFYNSAFVINSGYSESHNLDPERSLRILKGELELNPDNTRNMYYIAVEYMNKKNIKMAVIWFEKYRKIKYFDCNHWDNELANTLYLLALCYSDIETWGKVRWFDAIQAAHESWSVLPTSSDTAKLLRGLFGEPPGCDKGKEWRQALTYNFWDNILEGVPLRGYDPEGNKVYYKSCDEKGVMMKMNL